MGNKRALLIILLIAASGYIFLRLPSSPQNSAPTHTIPSKPGTETDNTYTNRSAGFSFSKPPGISLVETDGVIEVTLTPGTHADEAHLKLFFGGGVPYGTYVDAVQSAENNLQNPSITPLAAGVLYAGKEIPGAGGGIMTRIAIFKTKRYPTVVELVNETADERAAFEQIVSSFTIL